MKKQISRLVAIVLLTISILVIAPMAVYAQEEKVSILKTSEESYIIYNKDTLNTEFLFAFSENEETLEDDLIFSASGVDSNECNVAYMTKTLAESLTDGKTYMWIKVDEGVKTFEIDLNQAVDEKEIELVNTTTKRIEVDTTGNETTIQNVDGVKITHSQGKVTLTEQGNAFSYNMVKVASEDTTNFVALASKIINSENLTNYERINLVKEFNDTYTKIFEGIQEWTEVPENKKILQPQESKKGDIYLVWLKNDETGEHDVQILVCDEYQDIEVEEEKRVTVYETTKLPVTFDSIITLIIILAIVIATIIALVAVRKKLNQKED